MNWSKGNTLAIWSVALVVFTLALGAAADNKPKASAPHPSAPASHAAAPHAAAPTHPGGNTGGQHAGAPAGNRGASGSNGMNRGPGNANTNRGTGANGMNRGPGGAANSNRGTSANGANRGAGANTNRGAGANTNRGAGTNANTRGGNKAGGAQAGNRGGTQAANHGANQASHHQPAGSTTRTTRSGASVSVRKNGQVRTIHTRNGMTINHGMHGNRRVEANHNGRRVVAYGRHGGYSQRAYYRHGGHEYVQRTYWRGGHAYAYGYRSYYYGGHPYYGYAPGYYYGPAYYGWAYNPWPAPVYYNWGWGGAPWYGYYGAYYQPYPVYPFAALWLTDYLISANLQAAYAAQAEAAGGDQGQLVQPQFRQESSDVIASLWSSDPLVAASLASAYGSSSRSYLLGAAAGGAASGGAQMPADVKQAVADEMKNEIAAEKQAAANKDKDTASGGDQLPSALDPKIRYFVVSVDEDLTTSDGTECALTAGDVVYRTGDKPDDDNMVDATVKSSKKDECPLGATVGIDVSDLQDMHNSLRETMDEGLKKLADNNGKNGLPAAPDTKTTTGEVPPPAPDSNVQDDLAQTQKDADQAEADAKQPN